MSKNKLVIISIIIFIVVLIPFVLFFMNLLKKPTPPPGTPGTTPLVKNETVDTLVSFSPAILKAGNGATISADIIFDVGKYSTQGIILNMSYDPKKIKDFKFTPYKDPNSALINSLEVLPGFTAAETLKGTYSITFGLRKNIPEQKGRGIIGKVTATVTSSPAIIFIDPTSSAATKIPGVILNLGRVNLEITK